METSKSDGLTIDAVQTVDAPKMSNDGMTGEKNTEDIAPVATGIDAHPKPKSLDEPFKAREHDKAGMETMQYTSTKPVMVTRLERLGEEPAEIDCPFCKECKKTRIEKKDSSQTTLAAAACCLFCGVITVCIPCLFHWCADVDHYCTGCNAHVAHKPYEGQAQPKLPGDNARDFSKYANTNQEVSKYAQRPEQVT